MKIVLIIAPQFSPSSYPPSQRVRLFTNHLEKFGWKPVVLTVEPEYLEENLDWKYHELIQKNLEVIRVKAFSHRWTRKFGVGDLGIRSYWHLAQSAKKICAERKIDLLFIPGPPWHTFLIGPMIKKKFKVPYVLDYIDPWVSSLGLEAKPWQKAYWFNKTALWLEPSAVKSATGIVSVSEGTNELIRKRYVFREPQNFLSIPYGAEAKDFEFTRHPKQENRFFKKEQSHFNFVYIGAMLPKGYATLKAFFEAVRRIKTETPEVYERIRVYFIGTTYEADPKHDLVLPVAREMGLETIVKEFPRRIPYLESCSVLQDADAVLALGTTETHYTASKIYPAILSNRPLLAVFHEESSVTEVMRRTKAGELITYNGQNPADSKVDEIKNVILKIMKESYIKTKTNMAAFEEYSAENMTRELTHFFDSCLKSDNER